MALVSAIGRNLEGLSVARRGLTALEAAKVKVLALQDNGRAVDVQWLVPAEQADDAVRALHEELVSSAEAIAKPELDAEPLEAKAASLRAA